MGNPPKLPVIFIWDMDKCLIGDANFLLFADELTTYIMNAYRSEKIPSCKGITPLRNGVDAAHVTPDFFRPGIKAAFEQIQTIFDGRAEFFIFSHGAHEYVTRMVRLIEAHTGIEFNRPLLTRNDTIKKSSGKTEKSLTLHFHTIVKVLLAKYPALKKQENVNKVKESHVIYLDDNNWTEDSTKDRFLQVKPYEYTPVYDVLWNIPMSIRTLDEVQAYIAGRWWEVFNEPKPGVHATQRDMQFHAFMTELCSRYSVPNATALADKFFPEFVDALKKTRVHRMVHPFSAKTMDALRKTLLEKEVLV